MWLVTIEGLVRGVPGVAYKVVASLAVVSIGIIVGWLAYHPVSVLFGALGPREANGRTSGEADLPLGEALPAVSTARIARLMRAIWASLLVAAAIATARIWGFGLAAFGIGDSLAGALVNIAAVLLLGYVSWALVLRWIDARLENAAHDTDETRSKRLRTLLPLLRMFIRIVITAMVIMITLSSLGVDIGPLLAGAGIVGIAIGFGAQSTVANVLTGVSFLLVDAFRVGDYVEVGSIRGTVEGMSLTTLRLRHHRGAVHTLPFAEIRSMTNYSRDWMLIRLEFRIPQATDLGLIKRLVKSIGQDLIQNPEFGKHFVEPLKSQGVRAVEDNAIVIGIKFVARPDAAFTIRREAYERIIKAFQANGIELVGRGVVVKVEGTDSVVPTAAGAAARDVIERGDGNTKEA